MKTKYTSMFGLLVIALLVGSFVIPQSFVKPSAAQADPGVMRWTAVDTPGTLPPMGDITNIGGGLGSSIHDLAVGPDSLTLVATLWDDSNPSSFPPQMTTMTRCAPFMGIGWPFACYTAMQRSPDWGITCPDYPTDIALMNRQVYAVAIAPDDAKFWAVTTDGGDQDAFPGNAGTGPDEVWVTRNGGSRWERTNLSEALGFVHGAASNPNCVTVRALDISIDYGGKRDIAVATVDGAAGTGLSDIWVVKSSGFGGWTQQNITAGLGLTVADYYAVKFSPTYSGDSSLAFVFATDGTDEPGGLGATYYNVAFRDIDANTTNGFAFTPSIEVKDPSWATGSSPAIVDLNEVGLELPSDFSGTAVSLRRAYISTDSFGSAAKGDIQNTTTGDGAGDGIFRMDDTTVYTLMNTSQDATKSIYSIAYFGTYASGKLIAGERMGYPCTASVPTWFTDSPTTCPIPCWYPCLKCPTGGIEECVNGGFTPVDGLFAQSPCELGLKNGPGGAVVAWNPAGTLAYVVTGSDLTTVYIVGEDKPLQDQDPADWWAQWVVGSNADVAACVIAGPHLFPGPFGPIVHPPVPNLEGAFSLSRNNGETWNQLGMINTTIDWINDVMPSPDCSTVYFASVNRFNNCCDGTCEVPGTGCYQFDSVWRSSQNPAVVAPLVPATPIGMYWERVFTHTTSLDCHHVQTDFPILRLPPYCDDLPDGQLIAWAARGTHAMAWSPDYGDYWSTITPRDPVQDFAFESSKIMYVLAANTGAHDLVWDPVEDESCTDNTTPDLDDLWTCPNIDGLGLVQKLPFTGTAWSTLLPDVDAGLSGTHTIAAYPEGQVMVGADADNNLAMAAGFSPNFNTDTPAFTALWMIQAGALSDHGDVHVAFDTNFKTNGIVYTADENTLSTEESCQSFDCDDDWPQPPCSIGSVYRNTYPGAKRWVEQNMMDPSNGSCIPLASADLEAFTGGFYGIVNAFTGAATGSEGQPDSQTALYVAQGPQCEPTEAEECPEGTTCCGLPENSIVFRTLWPQDGMPKPGIVWDALQIYTPQTIEGVWFTLEPSSLRECGSCSVDTNTTLYAVDNEACGEYGAPGLLILTGEKHDELEAALPVCGACPLTGYDPLVSGQGRIWAYTDCLAKKGPALVTEDKTLIGCDPVSGRAAEVNLCWEQLCVATGYDIEIAKSDDFSIKVIDWVGTCEYDSDFFFRPERTSIPCAYIPAGGTLTNQASDLAVTLNGFMECGHTYYWRVQVRSSATGEVARSPWSETRSFSIKTGLPVSATSTGAQLLAPNNGALGVPAKSTAFSWSPMGETTKYKFQLAKDAAMTQIVKEDTTTNTAYMYDGQLDNSTNYFWRVQPLEPFPGDWSSTFSFQTEAPPAPPAAPAKAPATPVWVWVVIAIGAILVIVVLVLIFKTRRT